MRSYARQGDRGRALRHYQGLVQLLRDELASGPAPETKRLYENLQRGQLV